MIRRTPVDFLNGMEGLSTSHISDMTDFIKEKFRVRCRRQFLLNAEHPRAACLRQAKRSETEGLHIKSLR